MGDDFTPFFVCYYVVTIIRYRTGHAHDMNCHRGVPNLYQYYHIRVLTEAEEGAREKLT